jgi:hypothetical protein
MPSFVKEVKGRLQNIEDRGGIMPIREGVLGKTYVLRV